MKRQPFVLICDECCTSHHLGVSIYGFARCRMCGTDGLVEPSGFCDVVSYWIYKVTFRPHKEAKRKGAFFVVACCPNHARQRAIAKLFGHLACVQYSAIGASPLAAVLAPQRQYAFITCRWPSGNQLAIPKHDGHHFKMEVVHKCFPATRLPKRRLSGHSMARLTATLGTSLPAVEKSHPVAEFATQKLLLNDSGQSSKAAENSPTSKSTPTA